MKRAPRSDQPSLFGYNRTPAPTVIIPPPIEPEPPKLRIVPPLTPEPEEDVTIEAADRGRFWLTFTRDKGTTRGAVRVTRAQLEKLLRRIPGALEVG